MREYDLKLILAFGTVSQLGLITVMVGAGGGDLMLAGLAMLCAHAMFKAALFMVVGVIDHATGTRDIRRLAWLGQRSRPLLIIAVGATASMAALPPFLGFVAKEADFETVAHAPSLGAAAPYVLAGIVFGSVFTTIYSLRFLLGSVRPQGITGTEHSGWPKCTARQPRSSSPRRSWPPRGWCSACGRPAWTTCSTPTPTRCRAARATTSRCGMGSACRCCCRRWCSAVGAAAYFGRARLRRLRTVRQPLGNADRIYDAALRGLDLVVGAAHRFHPARFDPGHTVGDPVHAGAGSRDRARSRRP